MEQQTERMQALVSRPADAGAARRQPTARGRSLGAGAPADAAGAGVGAVAVRGPARHRVRGSRRRRACRVTDRVAQCDRQPGHERHALHAGWRSDRGAMDPARRRWRRTRRQRHRHGHRPRTPATHHRALLSRRRQPLAGHGRHRSGPGHRQARGAAARRRDRCPERARQRFALPPRLPGRARAPFGPWR